MIWLKRTILATGVCAAAAAGGSPGGAETDPLARFRWEARPVIVFAPRDDPRLREQTERFAADRAAMRDRDIVLIEVDGPTAGAEGGPLLDAAALRRRFDVAEHDFIVILVGKDGGEKARAAAVIEPRDVYDLIDTMPMRQQEMRRTD